MRAGADGAMMAHANEGLKSLQSLIDFIRD